MSVSIPLETYILFGVWGVASLVGMVLWILGLVACLRGRPAPGKTFLAIGFGLLAFLEILGTLGIAQHLLSTLGILSLESLQFDIPFIGVGYEILRVLMRLTAITLIVVGTMQSLRFAERE